MSINVVHGVYGMTFWGQIWRTNFQARCPLACQCWGRPRQQTGFQSKGWMRLIPIRSLSVWLFAFVGLIWELLQSPGNWFWKLIWRELPLLSHLPLYSPALHSHSPTRSEMMWNVLHIFCDWEARVEVQKSKNLFGRKSAGADLPQESRLSSHNFGWFWPITISSYLLISRRYIDYVYSRSSKCPIVQTETGHFFCYAKIVGPFKCGEPKINHLERNWQLFRGR